MMRLERWLSADERDIERDARALAERLRAREARFLAVRSFTYAGEPARSVVFDIGGSEFALVPAGSYVIGFDAAGFDPRADVRRSYAAAVRGFGYPRALATHLGTVLRAPARVEIPPMLVEVTARRVGYVPVATDDPQIARMLARSRIHGVYQEAGRFRVEEKDGRYAAWVIRATSREALVQELASSGFRLPASAEWEVACSAGRGTLFRWGDDCPLDRMPIDEVVVNPGVPSARARFQHHRTPNAFGLHIAEDPYHTELVSEPDLVRGGDGGEAVCGDYGTFLAWLPLASAFTDVEQGRELLRGGMTGHWYRRVLDVPEG